MHYVFFGYWSEYVLAPLCAYMRDKGCDCIEVTPDTCDNMRKAVIDLRGRDIVFVTSAHLFLDEHYEYFATVNGALSALEAMDILRPVKNIYYPHDLSLVVHELDMPWLSLFDLILMPMEGYAHLSSAGGAVHNVGWIKKSEPIGAGNRFSVAHAFSELTYFLNVGLTCALDVFKPIWDLNIPVKGPAYSGDKALESFLKEIHVNILDSRLSVFDLIEENEILLTNALTSVNFESALSGRFTINMIDGVHPESEQRRQFAGLPNHQVLSVAETMDLLNAYYKGDFVPLRGEDVLRQFDFQRAFEFITMRD